MQVSWRYMSLFPRSIPVWIFSSHSFWRSTDQNPCEALFQRRITFLIFSWMTSVFIKDRNSRFELLIFINMMEEDKWHNYRYLPEFPIRENIYNYMYILCREMAGISQIGLKTSINQYNCPCIIWDKFLVCLWRCMYSKSKVYNMNKVITCNII